MQNKFQNTINQRRQRILVVAMLDILCIAVSFLWVFGFAMSSLLWQFRRNIK